MFSVHGWFEDLDAAGAVVRLAAIADPILQTAGDDLSVPALNQLVLAAAGVGSGGDGFARLESPSLLRRSRFFINPVNGNADGDPEPDSPPAVLDMRSNPLQLEQDEEITASIDSDTTAASMQWVFGWFADGPIVPATGPMFTIRATNGNTLVSGVWTNGALTFSDNLAVGRYAIVGMRYIGATALAARLVFVGGAGWRPGVLGCDSDSDKDFPPFRMGGMGVFGEFESIQPPSVDFLANAGDTAQEIYFDLIRIREGRG